MLSSLFAVLPSQDVTVAGMCTTRSLCNTAVWGTTKVLRILLVIAILLIILLLVDVNPEMRQFSSFHPRLNLEAQIQPDIRPPPSLPPPSPKPKSKPGIHDPQLFGVEQYPHSFTLGGATFNESGAAGYCSFTITSSLLHSFSPWIEKEASGMFLDPAHENVFFANSPAITWFKDELVLVARIWLNREDHKFKNEWPINDFADNYLYTQRFDRFLKPISNGSIMGIPSPKQWIIGDGPIEPRVFVVDDRLLVTFNVAMSYNSKVNMDNTVIWDYERNFPVLPEIMGGPPMINISVANAMPRDKHWMAFKQDNDLYFVYNIDPLRILRCQFTGFCWFVYSDVKAGDFEFDDHKVHIRGGTPFELYKWPYYIGVAHSTLFKQINNHRFYTAHLVVLCVEPYRIVYVSDDLRIHPTIYENAPIVRENWIEDNFIFPVGIILESKDRLTLGVHVNDYSSILVRFKGIGYLMKKVMSRDWYENPARGAPVGYLQIHIYESQQRVQNISFYAHWRMCILFR